MRYEPTMTEFEIHQGRDGDRPEIDALYPEAFPDEELRPLVRELLEDHQNVLSLVARSGGQLVGHVIFTRCGVRGPGVSETVDSKTRASGTGIRAALLGPLCAAPAFQRRGIGGALISEGLRRLAAEGIGPVYVLGDPSYYGRHGFEIETGVAAPVPIPADWREAWQSLSLDPECRPSEGTLSVPAPWRDPSLWA
jgi:putative acetyltransferase